MYNPYVYEDERVVYPRVGSIIMYRVKRGDNVYRLAKVFGSEVEWIKCMNRLDEQMLIHPHQELMIPILFKQIQPLPQPFQRQSYDLYF